MRKLIAGLMVGGLLAMAAPAMAQFSDPLGLAASGVLIPFIGGGDTSLLEIASPVTKNTNLHMFFFNTSCTRTGDSVGLPETENDIAFLTVGTVVSGSGLITIAQADSSGFALVPLESPIHSRLYWFNASSGRTRQFEPIIVDHAEVTGLTTWSPLRTAATFFAPQDGVGGVSTTIHFICPKSTIATGTTSAFPSASGFPTISPAFPGSFGTDALRYRVYDTNEVFLRDVKTDCDCLSIKQVSSNISTIYGSSQASLGTYTEVESNPSPSFPFTGYRLITQGATNQPGADWFNRLSNANRTSLQGTLTGGAR